MEVPSRISESILNKQTLEWRLPKFKPRFFLYRFFANWNQSRAWHLSVRTLVSPPSWRKRVAFSARNTVKKLNKH